MPSTCIRADADDRCGLRRPILPSERPAEGTEGSFGFSALPPRGMDEAYPLPRSCLNERVGCLYPANRAAHLCVPSMGQLWLLAPTEGQLMRSVARFR